MRKLLSKNFNFGEKNKIIGIWIGARGKKKWDIKNFKKLFERIKSETEYSPILTFGIEEVDDYNVIDVDTYNAFRITDLKKLKSFIAACNIFVCGDTGPLHFSFALGTPTIGVFLEENYVRYGYTDGEKNYIIKPAEDHKMIDEIISNIKNILH